MGTYRGMCIGGPAAGEVYAVDTPWLRVCERTSSTAYGYDPTLTTTITTLPLHTYEYISYVFNEKEYGFWIPTKDEGMSFPAILEILQRGYAVAADMEREALHNPTAYMRRMDTIRAKSEESHEPG